MALPIIKIENARGEVLNLSADPRYNPMLTGTGPPPATINRAKVATADGTRYNSATVGERPLVLTIDLLRDIARARLNLYKWLGTKQYIKVYYAADGLDVWVDGYVETAEVDPWTQAQVVQASIICPQPYWRDVAETYTDASVVSAFLEFPFSTDSEGMELSTVDLTASTVITNDGTVPAGIIFELTANIRALQPRIYNLTTGEYMGFYVDMFAGDRLIVNTSTGQKSVTYVHEGVSHNYINTLMEGSKWLQMGLGANEFSYTTDEGECTLGIYHTNMYIGV